MEGFKIICLKCGKEKIITNKNMIDDPIEIYSFNYDGDMCIRCECGNEMVD